MPLTGEYQPSPSDHTRNQVAEIEQTNGSSGATRRGKPVVGLTSKGAQPGKLRKVALMRVEHDGEYAVVASLGGAAKNPVWYHNLKADSHVELQDGSFRGDFDAREVFGDEKRLWWERSAAVWPDYDGYQQRTDREIPVFVLTPR